MHNYIVLRRGTSAAVRPKPPIPTPRKSKAVPTPAPRSRVPPATPPRPPKPPTPAPRTIPTSRTIRTEAVMETSREAATAAWSTRRPRPSPPPPLLVRWSATTRESWTREDPDAIQTWPEEREESLQLPTRRRYAYYIYITILSVGLTVIFI